MSDPRELEVSAETLERMKKELEELTTTGREDISARLQRARAHGDIKENAEFSAAQEAQGLMEARIRKLEHMVRFAAVREKHDVADVVEPGVVVTLKEDGESEEYLVASSAEEKLPGMATVTPSSPLGKAIVGKKVGEKAEVEAPGGRFTVEITALRPA